jgi:hypothetical protein
MNESQDQQRRECQHEYASSFSHARALALALLSTDSGTPSHLPNRRSCHNLKTFHFSFHFRDFPSRSISSTSHTASSHCNNITSTINSIDPKTSSLSHHRTPITIIVKMTKYEGSCHCGAVTYDVEVENAKHVLW